MNDLIEELRVFIIRTLNLEEIVPDDIDPEAHLFGDGLGLDSIDALELGVALHREYGIVLSADSEETRVHFSNLASLARLIESHRTTGK